LIYSDYAKEIYFDHKKKSHLNHLIKPTEPNLTKLDCWGGVGDVTITKLYMITHLEESTATSDLIGQTFY
jgi:hypothetical protein